MKNGFEYEIREAMACIRGGRLESPVLPWRESLRLAEVSSHLIDHWGIRYPF